MDFNDIATDILSGLAYGVVGLVLLTLGYYLVDALTHGHLGKQVCEDRNPNAAALLAGGMLSVGLIVATAIVTSHGELDRGLIQTVEYGLLGLLLQGVGFKLVDIITPGNLSREIMGETEGQSPRFHPAVIYAVASQLALAMIIAAAIS